jgi:Flp pilus assembly protein TadG
MRPIVRVLPQRGPASGRLRRLLRREEGQVAIIFAILLPVMLLLAALAIDLGGWYDTDSGLQKAADLSAVAGAQYLATNGSLAGTPGYPCTSAVSATDCATLVAGLNGISSPETATAVQTTLNGNQAITVTARHPNQNLLLFSRSRSEAATAVWGGIAGATNDLPAIFEVPPSGLQFGQDLSFTFGTAPSPGAFNLTQTCAGGSPSENTLKQCFMCTQTYTIGSTGLQPNALPGGCTTDENCAGTTVDSAPGNKLNNNVVATINSFLSGYVVLIPMYDASPGPVGNGSGTTYTISGFAELLMDTPAATGGNGSNPVVLHGVFQKVLAPSDVQGSCSGSGENLGATTYYLAG